MKVMSEAKTNIVIPSWNGEHFTRTALDRIGETITRPYYLTVVDNGSHDGTVELLQKFQPSIYCLGYTAILNAFNRGPGGAYQQGFEKSQELQVDYTVLSNNDVYYSNDWLDKLEDVMEENVDIGILGTLQPVSKVAHPFSQENAKKVLQSASAGLSISEELDYYFDGMSFDEGADMMVRVNGGGLHDIQAPPDAVPTSCAIVNNNAVEEVGFVADPRYEVYGSEDIDLSWSLGKLGYRCAVLNDVYIHHFRHRSSEDSGLDFKECLKVNNRKFVKKWYSQIASILDSAEVRTKFISNSRQDELTKLRRINENVGFFQDGVLISEELL